MVAVFALLTALPASAVNYSNTYYHSNATASGTWETEGTKKLESRQSMVYAGDCGVWFYIPSVGMEASYSWTESRKVQIECIEEDFRDPDVHFRTYEGTFGVRYGLYQPCSYRCVWTHPISETDTQTGLIESSSGLELFIRFRVDICSGDTSRYVPKGILVYRYWTY